MKTYKILGLLLSYPSAELQENIGQMRRVLEKEGLLPKRKLKALAPLLKRLKAGDLLDLQEEYVQIFDRGRTYSLHLFEHIHGESRERGQAMVDLRDHYAEKGVYFDGNELPDYLPLFLEFLSILEVAEAQDMLNEAVHVVAMISAKLSKKGSDYKFVTAALEALASVEIDQKTIDKALEGFKAEESLEEIDEAWQEPEAFDGANPSTNPADCNSCSSAINSMVDALEKQTPAQR
jgi:nitrate reductase molybdenum cofactor assembly chaperone NarJ/NarW